MKWSWKIGQWRGIAVYVHATFLILIGFVLLSHWSQRHTIQATLEGVGFILAIFGLLTMENVGEFIPIRAALKSSRAVGVNT